MSQEDSQPIYEQELKDTEWLVNRLIEAELNNLWAVEVEAFLEYRVPRLIAEIRKLKKKMGVKY